MREKDVETEITLRSTEAGGQKAPETRPEATSGSPGIDAGVSAISFDFAHRAPTVKAVFRAVTQRIGRYCSRSAVRRT